MLPCVVLCYVWFVVCVVGARLHRSLNVTMAVSRAVVKASPEMRKQVVGLFRRVCREAPRMCALYELPMGPTEFRRQINVLFREHSNVTEERVISVLLQKGEMELEEGLNQWKQRSHVLTLLSTDLLNPELVMDEEETLADQDIFDKLITGHTERKLASAGITTASHHHPLE